MKDQFYSSLQKVLKEVPKRDFLVVMGDFNARVGNDCNTWKGIVGSHGIGDEHHDPRNNDNGSRLLDLCSQYDLSVTGTFFQHKDIHKYTWYQRGKDFRSQIDHILVRRKWLSAVNDTRAYRGAEFCNSDHRMVMAKTKVHLPAKRKQRKVILDLEKLKSVDKQSEYQLLLENRFQVLEC